MEPSKDKVIPSLSDSPKTNLTLIREVHPLPSERKAIVAKVGEILSLGRVQKVVLHVGLPIQVDRFVDVNTVGDQPLAIPADDLWLEARNSPILEYYSQPPGSGIITLYNAWKLITEQNCKVEAIFYNPSLRLSEWLGFLITNNDLFGAKVEPIKDMPNDSILLFGTSDLKTLSVRVPVDFPKKKEKK